MTADAAIDNALRQRTAPAALRGASAIETLAGVHARAEAALGPSQDSKQTLPPPVVAALARVRVRAAARGVEALVACAGDEDDLFYEVGGHAVQQLLTALVQPGMFMSSFSFTLATGHPAMCQACFMRRRAHHAAAGNGTVLPTILHRSWWDVMLPWKVTTSGAGAGDEDIVV